MENNNDYLLTLFDTASLNCTALIISIANSPLFPLIQWFNTKGIKNLDQFIKEYADKKISDDVVYEEMIKQLALLQENTKIEE